MTKIKSQELGKFAEDKAAEYINSLGWQILARNVRNKYGELDIISLDTGIIPRELAIIEVRARTIGKIQPPLDSIGPRKLSALVKSARELVNQMSWPNFWRIDFVGITIDEDINDNWSLEHVRNITEGMNIFS